MSNAFQGRTDAAGPITCSLIISGRFTQGTVSDCVHADLNMERHLNDSWIVADINKTDIINDLPENLWANLLRGMGKDYAVLANFPEHPSLN